MGKAPGRGSANPLVVLRRALVGMWSRVKRTFPRGSGIAERNRILVYTVVILAVAAVTLRLLFGGNLAQVLVTGIAIGSIYVIGATGLSLTYGIKKFANFAHGDLMTLGAYMAFFANIGLGNEMTWSFMVLIVILGLAGTVLEFLTVARSVNTAPLIPLVVSLLTTIGTSGLAAGALVLQSVQGRTGLVMLLVALIVVLAAIGLLMKVLIHRALVRGEIPATLSTSAVVQAGALLFAVAVLIKLGFGTVHLVLAVVFSMVVLSFMGILLELLVFRRLEGKGPVAPLIASVGVAIVVQNVIAAIFGTAQYGYDIPRIIVWSTPWFDIHPIKGVLTTAVALVSIILLHVILTRTLLGKAMRATADNVDLARSSGINTRSIALWTWAISMALAAVAGVLLALAVDIRTTLGFNVLLFFFAAVIIGGIGSPYGAMLGGFAVGIIQELSGLVLDWLGRPDVINLYAAASYRPMAAFLVMVIILLLKPEGLLGTAPRRTSRGLMLRARLLGA